MSITTPTDIEIEKMVTHYIQHGCQTKAWRHTYPNSKCKNSTAHVRSSEMANSVSFKEAVRNLRSQLIEQSQNKTNRSLEAYLNKLDAAYDMAMENKQSGGAVAALRQAAVMLGHDGKDADKDVPRYDSGVRRKPKLKVVDQS